MPNTKTDNNRREPSLFSDKFANENNSESKESETRPEQNDSPTYKNIILPSAGGILFEQMENPIASREKTKNHSLLEGERKNWIKAIFTMELDTELIEYLVNSHKGYISTIVCSITENGLLSTGVDSSNVGLVNSWLNSNDFNRLNIDTAGVFALDISEMDEWMSEVPTDDTVTISVKKNTHSNVEEDQDISIHTQSGSKITSVLPAVETIRRPPDIPELDLTSHIKIPLKEFEHVLDRCNEYSDLIEIKATEDGVQFSSEGSVTTITKQYDNSNDILTSAKTNLHTYTTPADSSLFGIDKIRTYMRRLKKTQTNHPMHLKFGENYPFKAKIKLTKTSYSKLMVAPRIES
jgi:DNA polymerase III sliding clamp (beta) subunit (PCNA family)